MALTHDLRLAVRSLARRPGFTGLAVLILALGIGVNTAMFSIVNAVLLRSLPYGDADRLVMVFADGSARGTSARAAVTPGQFLDWRSGATELGSARSGLRTGFDGLAVLRNESRRVTGVEPPLVPLTHAVTANYFDVLGVKPHLGRGFLPGEDEPGKDDVVVLSYGTWQATYAGDPAILSRTIALDGRAHRVVGVAPKDLYTAAFVPVQPGLWVPKPLGPLREERSTRDLLVVGRLAKGTSLASAQAGMTALATRLAAESPESNEGWSVSLVSMRDHTVGPFGATARVLLAAVGLVLLIACGNVASLTLARATERTRELALRTALGASRGRVVAQLLTESLVLSLAGGALGTLLAMALAGPLAGLIPEQAGVPFLEHVGLDGRVLLFTLGLSVLSGLAFGLAPCREATRASVVTALREGGRTTVSPSSRKLREGLVVAEVALAVVVAAGAGLMLQTFRSLSHVSPGFDAERILKLRTSLRGESFEAPATRIAHFEELSRRLMAIPGVASASGVAFEPPTVGQLFGGVSLDLPHAPAAEGRAPSAFTRAVLPRYFETMGIPVRSGRALSSEDGPAAPRVAVISESMARRYFEGIDPVGRTFSLKVPNARPMQIVGVVGDVMTAGTDPAPLPTFYVPHAQNPIPVMSIVMRVPAGDPRALAREAERVAWTLPGSTNVYAVECLADRIGDLNWRARFGALLLAGFAALALVLGATGIYAVISYTVSQRKGEIGLRMALGAGGGDVLRIVLGSGLKLAALGVAAGIVTSLALARALTGFLYGVSPTDPATLAGVAVLLLSVALAASLVPALRASRVDPQVALRE